MISVSDYVASRQIPWLIALAGAVCIGFEIWGLFGGGFGQIANPRTLWVQYCVIGAGGRMDDATLNACNAAYWKRMEVAKRGWVASQ